MTRNKVLIIVGMIVMLSVWVISRVYLSEQKSSAINSQAPIADSLGNPEEWKTNVPAVTEKKPDTWRSHVTMAGNRAFISFNGKDTLPDVDAEKDILPDAEAKSVILLILNDFEKENSVTIKNWIPYYTGYGNYRPIRVSGLWIDFEPNPKPTK